MAWFFLLAAPRGPRGGPKRKPPKARRTLRNLAKAGLRVKRAHRARLSQEALRKWIRVGHPEKHAYLLRVRKALEAEGFRHTPFQWRHKGHAFGLVRDLGDKQIHVRVYEDGVVDAELEIHKRFVEHLLSPRPSAHDEVRRILRKHGIGTELVNEHYLPRVGALRKKYPATRTKVSHALGSLAGIAAGVVAVSVARLVLKRKGRIL